MRVRVCVCVSKGGAVTSIKHCFKHIMHAFLFAHVISNRHTILFVVSVCERVRVRVCLEIEPRLFQGHPLPKHILNNFEERRVSIPSEWSQK